jgi:four helix bundle protein
LGVGRWTLVVGCSTFDLFYQRPTPNAQQPKKTLRKKQNAKIQGEKMEENSAEYNLEERLLEYSASIVRLVESMVKTKAGNHVGGQLLRSGTSLYFNHGEAEAAESARDFVHKMGICLKELLETKRALRLTNRVPLVASPSPVDQLLSETEELIKIFFASIRTAKKRIVREDREPYGDDPRDR